MVRRGVGVVAVRVVAAGEVGREGVVEGGKVDRGLVLALRPVVAVAVVAHLALLDVDLAEPAAALEPLTLEPALAALALGAVEAEEVLHPHPHGRRAAVVPPTEVGGAEALVPLLVPTLVVVEVPVGAVALVVVLLALVVLQVVGAASVVGTAEVVVLVVRVGVVVGGVVVRVLVGVAVVRPTGLVEDGGGEEFEDRRGCEWRRKGGGGLAFHSPRAAGGRHRSRRAR